MNKREKSVFLVEALVLILSFIGVILVLSSLFEKSAVLSMEARKLNDAVLLSENAAEIVKSCRDEIDLETFLKERFQAEKTPEGMRICFNSALEPEKTGEYRLLVNCTEKTDGYREAQISVYDQKTGSLIYSLPCASYREDE